MFTAGQPNRVLVASVVISLSVYFTHAQTTQQTQKPRRATSVSESSVETVARRRLMVARLESVGERAKDLDNTILKVRVLAKVADVLWAEDSSRARVLF